ncbi:6-phosphogluconolactonase 2 [Actinidia rufa]|uniref:6-phosphogluconolactonase 2 n=1 Tax=Actinidia rufa TaxID=165716 RepID=A0A7J0GJE0_9ERIC|nr:6-phosphogluconolactonase 2 [Actinidia rufa]
MHYLHVINLAIGMALSGDHNDRGELRTHESLDELKTDLADYIADLSEMSVKERGVFCRGVIWWFSHWLDGVSILSFPNVCLLGFCFMRFYASGLHIWWKMESRKLCEAPYNKTVDWAKWYIFWADERVVGKSHADSNYKLGKDGLLSKVFI